MRLHDHDAEGPPCHFMEGFLHSTADGTANRFARMYALAHAARCGRCNRFLKRLEETLNRVRATRQEPPQDALERLASGKWREEA